MNTIQVTIESGAVINYTEAEVLRFIKKAEEADALIATARENNAKVYQDIARLRNEVRDFFSEGEWSDGETVSNKADVNYLLERIGANKLTTKYRGAASIHFVFEIEAEDEDEARSIVEENASVNEYGFDSSDESVEITDIDENY